MTQLIIFQEESSSILGGECWNGEEFSWRKNFYHKPKAFINHYWNFSKYTKLKTAAYVSFGNGGGTSARGRGLQNQNVEGLVGMIHFKVLE